MDLTRRQFAALASSAAGAAALGMAGCSPSKGDANSESSDEHAEYRTAVSEGNITKVRTACGNCHNNCGMIANVKDGVIVSLEGDPEHPHGKGSLCPKGQAFLDVVYAPDRVTKPLKRAGERGEGKWEEMEWDEALDYIAERLTDIKENYGPEYLCYSNGAPVQNIVRNAFWEFYARFGTPNQAAVPNLCFVPRLVALNTTYGFRNEDDYNNADFIILWGANPFASMRPSSFMCYERKGCLSSLIDAMDRGVDVVAIDPICSETANKATTWIPIRPGTDGAMALAMIYTVIKEDLYDHDFVEQWCQGFDELSAFIEQYTPEWAEAETDVAAQTIADLARSYATTPRATIHDGNNFALQTNCVQATRAIAILEAITGHLDVEGGNCCFPDVIGNPKAVEMGNSAGIKTTVTVDTPPLASKYYPMLASGMPATLKAIETGEPYAPKAMMMYHTNGAITQAQPQRTIELLRKLDFIVVNDLFITETALQLADVFIPDCTFLERYDYRTYPSAQGTVVTLRQQAIEPRDGIMNTYDFEYALAERMGLAEGYPWTNQEEFITYAFTPCGLTFEDLKANPTQIVGTHEYRKYETGGLRPDGEPGFNTPDGKVDLVNLAFKKNGYDPLPVYVPPAASKSAHPDVAEQYPLVGINRRVVYYAHFKYRNNPYLREVRPDPVVLMNPADAEARSLADGSWIKLTSPFGEAKFLLQVSERVTAGVLWVDGGWGDPWDYEDSNLNVLVDGTDLDPVSQSPSLHSFLVEASKA